MGGGKTQRMIVTSHAKSPHRGCTLYHRGTKVAAPVMRHLRLKLSDLLDLAGQSPADCTTDDAEVKALVRRQFSFLPQPLAITVEGDEVLIEFQEEPATAQAEALRLAQKGTKRAAEGDYAKAIESLNRALKLQPSLHSARRDLAMAYVELGDIENATHHLIEVLRLDPTDAWHWVVLGNLYVGPKNDLDTGEKFLRKALALKPGDAWALNSLATLCLKRGNNAEALQHYQQALAANPQFASPYLGEAQALAAMQRLFQQGQLQDARSQSVFANARQLYLKGTSGNSKTASKLDQRVARSRKMRQAGAWQVSSPSAAQDSLMSSFKPLMSQPSRRP